jgi:hypothetical protein
MIEVKEDKLTVIKVPVEDVDKVINTLPKKYRDRIYFSILATYCTNTVFKRTAYEPRALIVILYKSKRRTFESVVNEFIRNKNSYNKVKVLIIVYQKEI